MFHQFITAAFGQAERVHAWIKPVMIHHGKELSQEPFDLEGGKRWIKCPIRI